MNKKEIIAKLTELGIEFDETVEKSELAALLPDVPVEDSNPVSVYNSSGKLIRTYSLELQGEDYKNLAKMYAGKVKGSVR